MRCPLIQLGVTVEEIRERLNNSTDDDVTIVTMMPSENVVGNHGNFRQLIAITIREFIDDDEWWTFVHDPIRYEKITLLFSRPPRLRTSS